MQGPQDLYLCHILSSVINGNADPPSPPAVPHGPGHCRVGRSGCTPARPLCVRGHAPPPPQRSGPPPLSPSRAQTTRRRGPQGRPFLGPSLCRSRRRSMIKLCSLSTISSRLRHRGMRRVRAVGGTGGGGSTAGAGVCLGARAGRQTASFSAPKAHQTLKTLGNVFKSCQRIVANLRVFLLQSATET